MTAPATRGRRRTAIARDHMEMEWPAAEISSEILNWRGVILS